MQSVIDAARAFPDLNPVLGKGGFVNEPALTIATDVMTTMLSPKFNWKWNRFPIPPILTNSWQQDYAIVQIVDPVTGSYDGGKSVTNLKWLEHGVIVDINNSATPKPIWTLECNRDLETVSVQYGRPGQVCWLPNDQLVYGTWGASNVSTTLLSFGNNPQANQSIVNPLGQPSCPANPITQIRDKNGNLLRLTKYGVTGASAPFAVANAVAGTIVTDGTCKWTVVDPKGQGLRLNPIPPQTGVVYMAYIIGQMRPPNFRTLGTAQAALQQTLEPIPDDYEPYFRQGFIAHCWRYSSETKLRAKFATEHQLWIEAMNEALRTGDRERDNYGFFPSRALMSQLGLPYVGPANPYLVGW